jgi:hypothetical protein
MDNEERFKLGRRGVVLAAEDRAALTRLLVDNGYSVVSSKSNVIKDGWIDGLLASHLLEVWRIFPDYKEED